MDQLLMTRKGATKFGRPRRVFRRDEEAEQDQRTPFSTRLPQVSRTEGGRALSYYCRRPCWPMLREDDPDAKQLQPEPKWLGGIHCEHVDCRPANWRPACNMLRPKVEVLDPTVVSRMKQAHKLSRVSIYASNVGAFVPVAVRTGESEIVQNCSPSMLLGNNVIDLEPAVEARIAGCGNIRSTRRLVPGRPAPNPESLPG